MKMQYVQINPAIFSMHWLKKNPIYLLHEFSGFFELTVQGGPLYHQGQCVGAHALDGELPACIVKIRKFEHLSGVDHT